MKHLCLLLLWLPVTSLSVQAAPPQALWIVAPEGGITPGDAPLGASVRDRFPDALVLDDPASAAAFAAAGFPVDGPLSVRPGSEVLLLRAHDDLEAASARAHAVDRIPGVDVLWSRGRNVLIQHQSELPAAGALTPFHRQVLSPGPLRWPRVEAAPPRSPLRATTFHPVIGDIVAAVDSAAYFPWIENLAGVRPVLVGGVPVTFTTRNTLVAQCDQAEQYVYETFVGMGFTHVEYDTFTVFPATQARNVIATLPGTETPEQIYILCGHLDSTQWLTSGAAPGANDNASGTAAVLLGAQILRNYEFRSTIKFIAFTGEEQGLRGSAHYAAAAAAAGDSILGVVNCDMIAWWETNYRVNIEGELFADSIMQVMNDACQTYTGLETALFYGAGGSDHVSFLNQGFPAFEAIESDWYSYFCYHKACDTADKCKVGFGVEVTQASLATIAHLAGIVSATSAGPAALAAPSGLEVWPNPFRTQTTIGFHLDVPEPVRLVIHDVSGRRVRGLLSGPITAGQVSTGWDGRDDRGRRVPPGVYFVRLQAGPRDTVEKAVRLR